MGLVNNLGSPDATRLLRPRLLGLNVTTGIVFIILVLRLYSLQILRGNELTSKGQKNFVQRLRVLHDRGIIFDRDRRIMVDNGASLAVQITPAFLEDADEAHRVIDRLATHLGFDAGEKVQVYNTVHGKTGLDRFQPITIMRHLKANQVEAIEADKSIFALTGTQIVEGRRRIYKEGALAAHLLGYVREIDAVELATQRANNNPLRYELGDSLGRVGVEYRYEKFLRGVDGYEEIIVDAKGRRLQSDYVSSLLGETAKIAPEPGRNLILTIDRDLQKVAETAFLGQAGAVVAMDLQGTVLAYASFPSFDPNRVSGELGADEKLMLDSDPLKPWLNRPIQGQYAPGSTYKIFPALAALQNRITSPTEKIFCPGSFKINKQIWRCHQASGHGYVDLRQAIKVSCDTFFYTLGMRLGINPMADVARNFQLGRVTTIPLPGEKPGLVPDEAFHDRVDHLTGGYQRGMAVNTAIGQGSNLVTPLQLLVAYTALLNGGVIYQPRIVERIESADFRVIKRMLPEAWPLDTEAVETSVGKAPETLQQLLPIVVKQLQLPEKVVEAVVEGLRAVTNEPGGTAYYRRSRLVSMGGKTGTAQVIRLGRDRLDVDEVTYFERDHAWFIGFAPAQNPEIIVVTVNEHSGHGNSAAAPTTVALIDAYFTKKRQQQEQQRPAPDGFHAQ